MNLPFLRLLCAMRKCPFGLLNVWDCHLLLLRLKIVANCRWGCKWAWGWRFVFVLSCSYWFSVAFLKVCHQDLFHEAYNRKPISLKVQKHDPHQEPFKHPRLSHPKRDNLPLRHTAHPTTPWSPTLTPPNLGQIWWFLEPCDLEIWRMTLQNNRAPLLCYFKLCAAFCTHWWIQT